MFEGAGGVDGRCSGLGGSAGAEGGIGRDVLDEAGEKIPCFECTDDEDGACWEGGRIGGYP